MSAVCTTKRKAWVDCGRRRTRSITTTEVRSRWPEPTAHYGDDYATYAARIQREARGYDEAGAARVHLVSATLAVASQRSVRRISPALSGARKRHRSRYRGIIQDKGISAKPLTLRFSA